MPFSYTVSCSYAQLTANMLSGLHQGEVDIDDKDGNEDEEVAPAGSAGKHSATADHRAPLLASTGHGERGEAASGGHPLGPLPEGPRRNSAHSAGVWLCMVAAVATVAVVVAGGCSCGCDCVAVAAWLWLGGCMMAVNE